jgi:hypothetical protein
MGEAIGAVLGFAAGVGLSPIPTIAVILILFSARARVNGPLFALSWLTGLTAVAVISYLLSDAADVGVDAGATDTVNWLQTGAGVLLGALALRTWRSRPDPGEESALPGWMGKLETIGPGGALKLGLLVSLNPKNLILAFAAASSLAEAAPTSAEAAVALGTFVVVGSAPVLIAVGYALAGGAGAADSLDRAKRWLTANNVTVLTVLYAVFAAVLISEGIGTAQMAR